MRKTVAVVRAVVSTGLHRNPTDLVRQLRYRSALDRFNRTFFYHRAATAILLGHEVGLLAALAGEPASADQVAARCGIRPASASALLRVFESEGLVERQGGAFALGGFAREFLLAGPRHSMAPSLDLMAAQACAFAEARDGMHTGQVPAELDIFSQTGRYRAFLEAVNSYLHWAAADLLQQIELPEIRSFIVGSMGVSFSARVLEQYAQARVTYGCLEHLVREIPRLRTIYGVPDSAVAGTHSHGGDPEADRWGDESFDLVFLTKKMILDPEARIGEKFAAKALSVLRPGGVAVFWESVHPDERPTPRHRAMEAVMDLIASPIGPVRTESQMVRLLEATGYRQVDIVPCLTGQTTFVVARR